MSMFRCFSIAVLLWLMPNIGYCEEKNKKKIRIDSLHAVIKNNADTAVVLAYIELGNELYGANLDTMTHFCLLAQNKSEKALLNRDLGPKEIRAFRFALASAYNNLGYVDLMKGNSINSLDHYTKARTILEEIGEDEKLAINLLSVGYLYNQHGDVGAALQAFGKALEIQTTIGHTRGQAYALNNIAAIHTAQRNYTEAVHYFNESLKLARQITDPEERRVSEIKALNNIGTTYLEFKNDKVDSALFMFQSALELVNKSNDLHSKAVTFKRFGQAYAIKNDFRQAQYYYEKSRKLYADLGDNVGVNTCLISLGDDYLQMGQLNNALNSGLEAMAIADSLKHPALIRSSAKLLESVYHSLNLKALSSSEKSIYLEHELEMYKLRVLMRDSVKNQENMKAAIKSGLKYEFEKVKALSKLEHDAEIAIKEEHNKTLQSYTYGAIIVIILIIAFSLFIANRLKFTRKQNKIIAKQKSEVMLQRDLVDKKNEQIIDSINYAERIQASILTSEKVIRESFPDSFVYFKPKDIIGGDFYWFGNVGAKSVIAAIDCTGHGVPGALITMVASSLLNEIILTKGIVAPDEILHELDEKIIKALVKPGEKRDSVDGMDLSLCVFDQKLKKMSFAGAKNHLMVVAKGEMSEIKADLKSIGTVLRGKKAETFRYKATEVDLVPGTAYYLYTDGYTDQFCKDGVRVQFSKKTMFDILNNAKPMVEQREIIADAMASWIGNTSQIDDQLVIGIRIPS